MIAFIQGQLVECQLTLAILEINGIGYEVHVPLTTVERLPSLGEKVKLLPTQLTVKIRKLFTVLLIANLEISSE